ncbi:MAG: hypothetical protein ABII80_01665, partial [bacterium]
MRRKIWRLIVLTGLLLMVSNINSLSRKIEAQEEKEDTSAPKVTKIVLYKHGMGYFERQGTVKGNETISLSFKTHQMKDLLTSLFAIDLDGGKITSIGYDSKDPIEKQMENILIRV